MQQFTLSALSWSIAAIISLLNPLSGPGMPAPALHTTWRTIPTVGFASEPFGQVWSLVGGEDGTLLFAATARYFDSTGKMTGHGVYRSDDGGYHWLAINQGLNDEFVRFLSGGSPGQPLFAATDTGWVYRSDDSGENWQPIGTPFPTPVTALLGGMSGHPIFAIHDAILYRCEKDGNEWTPVPISDASNRVSILVGRPPERAIIAVTSQGMYRSQNEGQTWQLINAAFNSDKVESLLGGVGDDLLIAIIRDDQGASHMERSVDHGDTWQFSGLVRGPSEHWVQPEPIAFVGLHDGLPLYRITMYGVDVGASRSVDGGLTWQKMPNDGMHWSYVWTLLGRPGQPLFAVSWSESSGGIYRSDDNGEHWHLLTGLNGSVIMQVMGGSDGTSITVDTLVPRGKAGNGGDRFLSSDGGRTWHWISGNPAAATIGMGYAGPAVIGTVLGTGPDGCMAFTRIGGGDQPIFVGTMCMGENRGGIYRSDDGGRTWVARNTGLDGYAVLSLSGGATGQPLYASVGFATTPMSEASRIYRSDDGGEHWYNITGWPITIRIEALAIGADEQQLLAAASDGRVFRSTDGGAHWQVAADLAPSDLRRSADHSPLNITFKDGQIIIKHDRSGWSYRLKSPLPWHGPSAFDYNIVGGHLLLVAIDTPDVIQSAMIALPWSPFIRTMQAK